MMPIAVAALMFLCTCGLAIGGYYGLSALPHALVRRRVASRLRDAPAVATDHPALALVKKDATGPVPGLDRLVGYVPLLDRLPKLIEQAGLKMSAGTLLLASAAAGLGTGFLAAMLLHLTPVAVAAGVIAGVMPIGLVRHRRTMRLRRFEEAFPEALDLLSRAIRAGHALATGLGMVADEMEEPVGPEFKKAYDEQNFGLSLKDALTNLSERVPLIDVRFFVTAVLIQRETGGNLAEILDNLAHVVRERFKILRQVRVYTAHGRLTGHILTALPVALAVALSFINPDHMAMLFRDRTGHFLLAGAVVLQVVGYLAIRKIVRIKV